jgi:hypothetical protein
LDPAADLDGDGLTNLSEYRGVKWGKLVRQEPSPNGPYDVAAYVPEGAWQGTVSLIRTNPYNRDLFVKFRNFDATHPFAVNEGFKKLTNPVDVHALDEALSAPNGPDGEYKIDTVLVELVNDSLGSTQTPHIERRNERDWKFQTLGKAGFGDVDYAQASVYKKSLDALFNDKPHYDHWTFTGDRASQMSDLSKWNQNPNGSLDPLSKVEDANDNGVIDSREDKIVTGRLNGDYPLPITDRNRPVDPAYVENGTPAPSGANGIGVDIDPAIPGLDIDSDGKEERWDFRFHLNPFDVDNDGLVEVNLPVVASGGQINPLYENSLPQVLMLTVTHELGHAVGVTIHTSMSACNMYQETNNFVRQQFTQDAAGLIWIHNK